MLEGAGAEVAGDCSGEELDLVGLLVEVGAEEVVDAPAVPTAVPPTSVPSSIAAPSFFHVVAAIGHPLPSPSKFCSVTAAAFNRACLPAFESSIGKVTLTLGLFST